MPRTPRRLPSGLLEGSPAANAAEAAESARLDRELGLTPPTPQERAAAVRRGEAASRRARRSGYGIGLDLRGA